MPDADPPDLDSRHQHVGEPGPVDSQALFAGEWAIGQLWLFWVAPLVGAAIGAIIYKALCSPKE